MKAYELKRLANGDVQVEVVDGGKRAPLRHLQRHSPTGFEWGYAGSGPADLARSILGDVLGQEDPSPREYQRVKFELVANVPKAGGVITEAQVRRVLHRIEAGEYPTEVTAPEGHRFDNVREKVDGGVVVETSSPRELLDGKMLGRSADFTVIDDLEAPRGEFTPPTPEQNRMIEEAEDALDAAALDEDYKP